MNVKNFVLKNRYYDSVVLMAISGKLAEEKGIVDVSVIMGTAGNKELLKNTGLLTDEGKKADANDLIISIKAEDCSNFDDLLKKVFNELEVKSEDSGTAEVEITSLNEAIKNFPDSNLVLLSIPGPFVKREAKNALFSEKNVMIFSDNVTIEEEKELKELAREKGLIVMGPDCGTVIINGKGIGFANNIPIGRIAVIGASGTGIQEVTSLICNQGYGIKHAIGLGSRDLSEKISGLGMLTALDALENDSDIDLVILISKPPHPDVEDIILNRVKNYSKKVIVNFLKGDEKKCSVLAIPFAATLEDAANLAVSIIENKSFEYTEFNYDNQTITNIVNKIKSKIAGAKFLRGLYSGGTLCDESLYILEKAGISVYSNIPLKPEYKLDDSWISKKHTLVDLGEDEFTKSRPHPMIDYSLRCERIIDEAIDPETGIILLDIVTGFGSHANPAKPLSRAIEQALEINPSLVFIAYICGTKYDKQNVENIKDELEKLGVIFMPTNAQAAKLCVKCLN